ncbi:MAG: HAMP domain-containing histidine kinase [Lachnospiraceae bacterium]|nr:HAMP domain-containing histidine kinase [Lachnospiraceae bacterium]
MKTRILRITILFSSLIIGITVLLIILSGTKDTSDRRAEKILDCNEISQLIDMGEYEKAREKLADFQDSLRNPVDIENNNTKVLIICCAAVLCIVLVFLYVYFKILRPFDKMKDFASEVAKGNFDVPLKYERSNYFGAFTWAFDIMRKEITSARMAEHEAVENNKTVIATLSHDIKTPIASIRAYAEGLEANLDVSPERRSRYLQVMMKKCDEVTELTNDLFLHSLSDMGRIEIKPEEIDLVPFMEQTVADITADKSDVIFIKPDFSPVISADKKRMTQLVENLINNSRKYAKTDIRIFITEKDNFVQVSFSDMGSGIPDEDMPFITDKFYRGKNCGNENGSGLGLYIVKYIAEKSGGSVELQNMYPGLKVTVTLPMINKKNRIS